MSGRLGTVSAGMFEPLAGSDFLLRAADGLVLPMRLARCTEHPRGTMRGSPRTAFSLEFHRSAEGIPAFTGRHFLLSHSELGDLGPLYVERILPTGCPPGTAVFEIVFN